MFYHANTCKECCNVLHVGLGHVGLLCNCLSVLCLPHLCPGKFLYALNYVCDVFPGVFLFEFECDHFHALFLCEVCRCDILGKCFHFKPQPMQPN